MKDENHPFKIKVDNSYYDFDEEYNDFLCKYSRVLMYVTKTQLARDLKEYEEVKELVRLVDSQRDGDDYIGHK